MEKWREGGRRQGGNSAWEGVCVYASVCETLKRGGERKVDGEGNGKREAVKEE